MDKLIQCTVPVLPVKNLKDSLEFYTSKLDFNIEWQGDVAAAVSRDGCQIMLSQIHGEKKPTWVWIGVSSHDWFVELPKKGVRVRQKPLNQEWAYEMKLEDIDGNILWLGTAARKDIPFVE
ncbi:hypothetical protein F7C95_07275 [Opitutia bacterium ISCC 51]|nr:hypothetical protein F7C95_07275 [Opitutae bacterium ISCC 51]QXD29752.1 hypothetical protein GA003_07235 [Opitutae bacterium ISCC 52]